MNNSMWFVYILKCADGTFYTGITTDVKRRLREHNGSGLGAKYTNGRRPVKLIYVCPKKNKSLAAREEYRIKKLTRKEKKILTYPHIHSHKQKIYFKNKKWRNF